MKSVELKASNRNKNAGHQNQSRTETFVEGSSMKIVCVAEGGFPRPNIGWFEHGVRLKMSKNGVEMSKNGVEMSKNSVERGRGDGNFTAKLSSKFAYQEMRRKLDPKYLSSDEVEGEILLQLA